MELIEIKIKAYELALDVFKSMREDQRYDERVFLMIYDSIFKDLTKEK